MCLRISSFPAETRSYSATVGGWVSCHVTITNRRSGACASRIFFFGFQSHHQWCIFPHQCFFSWRWHLNIFILYHNAVCFLFKYLLNCIAIDVCIDVSLVVMILCVHNLFLGSDSVVIYLVSSFLHLLLFFFSSCTLRILHVKTWFGVKTQVDPKIIWI